MLFASVCVCLAVASLALDTIIIVHPSYFTSGQGIGYYDAQCQGVFGVRFRALMCGSGGFDWVHVFGATMYTKSLESVGSFPDLTNPITQNDETIPADDYAFTGCEIDGALAPSNCNDFFEVSNAQVHVGLVGSAIGNWLGGVTTTCNEIARIYCISFNESAVCGFIDWLGKL